MHMPSTLIYVTEAAEYLRVNQRTVFHLAVDRGMRGCKSSASWRFKRSDLELWISETSSVEAEPAASVRAARRAK